MKNSVLISIFCEDQTGLVANITSRLFDLGINLGDTNFAVLGSGAEFTSVCEIPQNINLDVLKNELKEIDHLVNARIDIQPFTLETTQGSGSKITHIITITGGDQPGLIARLCETFIEYGTNIVRMSSKTSIDGQYIIRLNVNIPEEREKACLATIANTAEGMQLTFEAYKTDQVI